MKSVIKFNKEKKVSLKIIAHKLKKLSPNFLYKVLLRYRYAFFKSKCSKINTSEIFYSDGDWVERKTTKDLMKIQDYLDGKSTNMKIFQVGIGNSSLFSHFKDDLGVEIHGVTIVSNEICNAKQKFPEQIENSYFVHLMNKYSDDVLTTGSEYDYIVDNDLSSYACCKFHFYRMLENYNKLLKLNGELLVGYNGLSYFDSGFGLTENQLYSLASQFDFLVSKNHYCYVMKKIK
ncbi:hypothetical protein [Vibrio sp. MACH09]|uniref:hypothetical protein n=1 Tax=Vibrio sp. MACH09 TaxID=3025122 RepID=UPI00295E6CFA|nr:hypothetical protein [Vibrio sp. MACH09]